MQSKTICDKTCMRGDLMQNTKKFYTGKYDRVFKTILFDEDDVEITKEF